jgi:ubiquinone/menaquinone biosynthesis C-methylase UbiE
MAHIEQKEVVREFFDNIVQHVPYETRYQKPTTLIAYEILTRKAAVLAALDQHGRAGGVALDVGCGPAVFTRELLDRGYSVLGIDSAPAVVARAREVVADHPRAARATFTVGDVEQLEVDSGSVDAVLAVGLVEYLGADTRALREIRRVLRPQGIAIVTMTNRFSYYAASRAVVRPLRPLMRRAAGGRFAGRQLLGVHQTRTHTRAAFEAEAKAVGLVPLAADYVNFSPIPFNIPGRLPGALVRMMDAVNERPALRRRLAPVCGTYIAVLARMR